MDTNPRYPRILCRADGSFCTDTLKQRRRVCHRLISQKPESDPSSASRTQKEIFRLRVFLAAYGDLMPQFPVFRVENALPAVRTPFFRHSVPGSALTALFGAGLRIPVRHRHILPYRSYADAFSCMK